MKRIVYGDARIIQFVEEKAGGQWGRTPAPWTIGLEREGSLIAGVVFDSWNGASLCIHVAAEPGARWMTRDYLQEVFRYPFGFLKAKKLVGLVGKDNFSARRFDEHLGFVLEATLPDAHLDGALLVYTMTAAQCRWLNRRGNGKEQRTPG